MDNYLLFVITRYLMSWVSEYNRYKKEEFG